MSGGDTRESATQWRHVLQTLVCYRLIDPGSEWRLHRYWFDHSAMADLLGEDFRIAQKDTLYRCHDRLLEHREDLFKHLRGRWEELFDANYEVLLYVLTSKVSKASIAKITGVDRSTLYHFIASRKL